MRARLALRPVLAQRMNQTEARYARELDLRVLARELHLWRFEAVKLRLADTTFYTPDFWVLRADGTVECHEVKGFWRDDARVKLKVAAEQYPELGFVAVKWVKGAFSFEKFA